MLKGISLKYRLRLFYASCRKLKFRKIIQICSLEDCRGRFDNGFNNNIISKTYENTVFIKNAILYF